MTRSSDTSAKRAPEIEAFVRLVRAGVMATRDLSEQLSRDHGLTINEYEAMLRLARAPRSRMRRVDLANSLLLSAGGVTRLLDGLERDGYVCREECTADRRVSYAALTPAGRRKFRAADKSHTRQIRELIGTHLGSEDVARLLDLLGRLPGATPEA